LLKNALGGIMCGNPGGQRLASLPSFDAHVAKPFQQTRSKAELLNTKKRQKTLAITSS